jgi:Tfp pilus assembly protein FimV
MVAIHSPSAEHEWLTGSPAPIPAPTRRPDPRPAPAERRRRLPDRSTRIRRRRLAVLVVAIVLTGLVLVAGQALASLTRAGPTNGPEPLGAGDEPVAEPVAGQRYVVQPGDTLWSIAAEIAPGSDPRPVVDALRAANGDASLDVGEVLILDVE